MTNQCTFRALSINPVRRTIEAVRATVPKSLDKPDRGRRFSSRYRDSTPIGNVQVSRKDGVQYRVFLLSNSVSLSDPNPSNPPVGFRFTKTALKNEEGDSTPDLTALLLDEVREERGASPRSKSFNQELVAWREKLIAPRHQIMDCAGFGLLVAFELVQDEDDPDETVPGNPIDLEWDASEAARYLASWTAGTQSQYPIFKCALREKFNEPWKWQLNLRLDNRDELEAWYNVILDQPVRHLSPEVIDFTLAGRELTVMCGRVSGKDSKVRIVVLRTDEPQMRQVAAATLGFEKAADWLAGQLNRFFRDEFLPDLVEGYESTCWADDVYADARDEGRPAVQEQAAIEAPGDVWPCEASSPKA